MLTRLRTAGLLWPTLLSIPALVLLVSLGNWQMSRKAWKDALIAQIEAGLRGAPVSLDEALRGWPCTPGRDCAFPEYRRVQVRGRFEHAGERYLYAPDPRLGSGVHVYTPLVLADGRRVMVNRGFVPDAMRSPSNRSTGQPPGAAEVVGLLRAPGEKASFTPDNDVARNVWYWRDLDAMTDCKGGGAATPPQPAVVDRCASFIRAFIDAEAEPTNPGGWPRGGATNFNIPNRHLEYALTWYGLAVTLLVMVLVFSVPRWRNAGKNNE